MLFKVLFASTIVSMLLMSSGCALVRFFAGADVDEERFAIAREAAMLDLRASSAAALSRRVASADPVDNADVLVQLNESAVNKAAAQLAGARGQLDEATTYAVNDVRVAIHDGAAVATLGLRARNDKYDVDVLLAMDCLLAVGMEKDKLVAKLEPFNIAPDVTAGGLLSGARDIIRDILKVRLAGLGADLPPLIFPVDFSGIIPAPGTSVRVSTGINLLVNSQKRLLRYSLKIKEVLFFRGRIIAALNVTEVRER